MSGYRLTLEEFAQKIDYEGGVFDALAYGLRSNDLTLEAQDSVLARQWAILEREYDKMRHTVEIVEEIVEDLLDE